MRDVGIQFNSALLIATVIRFLLGAALITKICPQVVFATAFVAVHCQLATWHRNERSICSFNDFQIVAFPVLKIWLLGR